LKEVTVGLIPAPELPEVIADNLADRLPRLLKKFIEADIDWKIEVVVDPLTGAAEHVSEILEEAKRLKERHQWTYAICLTDLPIYSDKDLVLADANAIAGVAQISLPAFGAMPMKKRVKRTIIQMVSELYYGGLEENPMKMAQRGIGPLAEQKKRGLFQVLMGIFYFSAIKRVAPPEELINVGVRFIIIPKLNGKLRVLMGMTYANRPWKIMPSFKSVVAIAFATGAYGLIFPTLWKLSVSYSLGRFIGLNAAAVLSMIIWIIFSHNLWEPVKDKSRKRLYWLYNTVTIATLGIAVLLYYAMLFCLFLVAVSLYVPPSLYGSETGIGDNIDIWNYLKLAWLVTSVATIAGAIGAGLENGELVRNVTYGYRQQCRYERMEREAKEREEQEERWAKEP